ncbi:MAG: hypothetical protein WCI73_13680 [Phycisphaerae bacterium]
MAELIPTKYRLRVATKQRVERWVLLCLVVTAGCVATVLSAWAMEMRVRAQLADLVAQRTARTGLITRATELVSQREALAQRLATIQRLQDDRTVLAALSEVASHFSEHDRLEFIRVSNDQANKDTAAHPSGNASAQVRGITENASTMAELMTRLSHTTTASTNVVLETSRRGDFVDSQVMRFQLLCLRAAQAINTTPPPAAKGSAG